MWRKVLAAVLTGLGGFLIAAMVEAVESFEHDDTVGPAMAGIMLVLGLIPAAMLLAAWLLVRRANRPPTPSLDWPPTGPQWLPQPLWRELPDLAPERPRRRPRPLPAIGVPPDEGLRKLWAARAEVAHGRRWVLGWLPVSGWLGMLALLPLSIFVLALIAVTVEDYQRGAEINANVLLLDWGVCLLAAAWYAIFRPLSRHRHLMRLERQLSVQLRGRPDIGAPLPPSGTTRLVTDPVTGLLGYYHPLMASYALA